MYYILLIIETEPTGIDYAVANEEWPTVLMRVLENHESYRKVANDYGVSHETIRRMIRATWKRQAV